MMEGKSKQLTIPAFRETPVMSLELTAITNAESRLIESKNVNPSNYSDLEYTFNEGYREAKKHLSTVGYQITRAQKALRDVKSVIILDEYPNFLKENKLKDNSEVRDSFLQRNKEYVEAQDRMDMLKAVECLLEGKVKVFENVCRYMRKEMDLIIRSGVDSNKYIRR